jgi:hypothetical protein
MKHQAQPLHFNFGHEAFALVVENTLDGERLSREQALARRERERALAAQIQLPINPQPQIQNAP